MLKRFVLLLGISIMGMGCITIGSKDIQMLQTVSDVLLINQTITEEDHKILTGVIGKYNKEVVENE